MAFKKDSPGDMKNLLKTVNRMKRIILRWETGENLQFEVYAKVLFRNIDEQNSPKGYKFT